jgi:SAM-dependent methyltransferase
MQGGVTVENERTVEAGQAVYTRFTLSFYDLQVLGFNFPVLWRCPKERLLQLYDKHVSSPHLDVGVGSGYLIDKCRFPTQASEITLMDMNLASLKASSRRLRRYAPRAHRANVLEPWRLPEGVFDSVAMVNLLHCVPGTLREKAIAVEHARDALAPGGVFFGATVLGAEANHTIRSRRVMQRYNRLGMFSNLGDRIEDLDAALSDTFATHEVEVEGAVALFAARKDVE